MMAVDPTDECTFWYTQQYYVTVSEMDWRTKIGRFSFPSCSGAPVPTRVSVTAATPSASEAGTAAGAFTLSRTGDTSEPLTVTYTIGGTAQPTADYVALSGVATFGINESQVTVPVTPIDDPFNEPGETVAVTVAAGAGYAVGHPSQAVVTIVSEDLPADLVVSLLTVPTAATPGGTMAVTSSTNNQGGGAAVPSVTAFYLSTNFLFDAADQRIGTRTIAPLGPGFADAGTTNIQLPPTTGTGTYYIIARADDGLAVGETNENNNLRFSIAIKVGPDLTISAITASPVNIGPGSTVTVTDTARNPGSTSAAPTVTAIYYSTNALLDAADTLLGTRNVPSLAPDGVSVGTTSVQIPSNAATGVAYLFAKADVNNAVLESVETNNGSFPVTVRIGPDLTVSALSVPNSALAGATVTVNETTSNIGGGAAGASVTRFYLSVNLAIDAGDVELGTRNVQGLAAGGLSSAQTPLVIPANTPAGTYWIIAVSDATGMVAETFETNNNRVVFVRVNVGG
jgi:subtilase family serine protease